MAKIADFKGEGPDPRLSFGAEKDADIIGQPGLTGYTRPQMRKLHDPNVQFEEYHYYALQTRAEEEVEFEKNKTAPAGILSTILPSKSDKGVGMEERRASLIPTVNTSDINQRATISDQEWTNASRAVRTAGVGASFYLITVRFSLLFCLHFVIVLT